MEAKEKALSLMFQMAVNQVWHKDDTSVKEQRLRAKKCALIAVDEILLLYKTNWNIYNSFWQEVKSELLKL